MEAVGLALCKHSGSSGKFLFRMPRYADLKPGDLVIVETKHGEQEARVIQTATAYTTDDEYKMLMAATGATLPLKRVLRKVVFRDFSYDDEDIPAEEVRQDE